MVRVVYADEQVARLCTKQKDGQAEFGDAGWKRLKNRIKELEASDCLEDLLDGPGSWHVLQRDRRGCYAGKITGAQRIVVEQTESTPGRVEISVRVIEIVDYH